MEYSIEEHKNKDWVLILDRDIDLSLLKKGYKVSDFGQYRIGSLSEKICSSEYFEGRIYGGRNGIWSKVSAREGSVRIESDPLGARCVFYSKHAISNSFDMMRDVELANKSYEINTSALHLSTLFANLITEDTPIRGTRLAPLDHAVEVVSGEAKFIKNESISPDVTVEALKTRACEEIISNFETIKGSGSKILFEMTGGLDSRLAFSAAMHLGLQERMVFGTYGGKNNLDRIIAEKIAAAYGIEFSVRPQNSEIIVDSDFERVFEENFRNQAGIRVLLGPIGFSLYSDPVIVGGAFGEISRNFHQKEALSAGLSLEELKSTFSEDLALKFFRNKSGSFLSSILKRSPKDLESEIVSRLCDPGKSASEVLYDLYLNFRNRMHFGLGHVALSSRFNKVSPLYSPVSAELVRRLEFQPEVHDEFGFWAIDQIFPALNTFPYEKNPLPSAFVKNHPQRRYLENLADPRRGSGIHFRDINFFGVKKSGQHDYVSAYFDNNLERLSGILDVFELRKALESKNAPKLKRRLTSAVMFLKLSGA